jgi:hypothetical protein
MLFRTFGSRLLGALAVACLLLPASLSAAPGSDAKDVKKTEAPAEKIKKALDQTTDLELENQPLGLAINQLREQTKLNFVLDRWTIQQLGIDPDQSPVNVKLTGVKLRTALRAALSQYNLGYAIVGDTVLITTDDMAMHRQMRQHVNVDVEGVSMTEAVRRLARETGTNVLIDTRVNKEADTKVTLQLEDVPLDTAIRLMAEMAGLKPVRVGNVLFVTSKANANDMRQDPDLANPNNPYNPVYPVPVPGGMFPGGIGGIVPGIAVAPVPPPAVPVDPTVPAPDITPPAPPKPDAPPPAPKDEKPPDKDVERKPA